MLTSIGVFIDYTFVALGTLILICLVVFYGYRKEERGLQFWALRLGEIIVAFIIWQILFAVLRLYTYTGGTAEQILFKHVVSNVAAYLIVIVILIYLERKLSQPMNPA